MASTRPALLMTPLGTGVGRMRAVATGLLLLMAAIYLVTRWIGPIHPAIGFIRAFAEAGMVGGMADWFAVTALFRHPLGVPIPHTAIIPRNKDRIGDTLAQFLRDNFLTPTVIARRMWTLDVAAAAGRLLASPPSASGRLREGVSRLAADVLGALDQKQLGGMVKGAMVNRIRDMEFAPLLGQALSAAIADDRHLPLLDDLFRWARRTLASNDSLIREMVHARAGSILRFTGLDENIANAIINGLEKMLEEVSTDPGHRLRLKIDDGLNGLASDLQHDPEMRAKVAGLRDTLIENPALARWLEGLWEALRSALLKAARDPDAVLAGKVGDALRQLGTALQEDDKLRATINRFARRVAVGTAASYGDGIVKLVSETVRGWDAETITGRLESAVGRDLQYIRVNGTLVGGLVGVLIHTVDVLM